MKLFFILVVNFCLFISVAFGQIPNFVSVQLKTDVVNRNNIERNLETLLSEINKAYNNSALTIELNNVRLNKSAKASVEDFWKDEKFASSQDHVGVKLDSENILIIPVSSIDRKDEKRTGVSKNLQIQIDSTGLIIGIGLEEISGLEKVKQKGKLNFKTTPQNTQIIYKEADNDNAPSSTPVDFALLDENTRYKITISKNGYKTKDTIITVKGNTSDTLKVRLEENFAKIKFNIRSEDEKFPLSPYSPPKIFIYHRGIITDSINLLTDVFRSFDNGEVEYFKLYKDTIVPLRIGATHKFVIKAAGFKDKELPPYDTEKTGMDILNVRLTPQKGYVYIKNVKDLAKANIFFDNNAIGEFDNRKIEAITGQHYIRVEKENFLPDKEVYITNVREGKTDTVEIAMYKYKKYYIQTNPKHVEINGGNGGFTPRSVEIKETDKKITLKKDDLEQHYLERRYNVKVNSKNSDTLFLPFTGKKISEKHTVNSQRDTIITLKQTEEITIKTDKDSIRLAVLRMKPKKWDKIYEEFNNGTIEILEKNEIYDTLIPKNESKISIKLPYNEKYYLILYKRKKYDKANTKLLTEHEKIVGKGFGSYVKFTKPKNTIPFHSIGGVSIISGDYSLLQSKAMSGTNNYYNLRGYAQFLQPTLPVAGLSIALIRASFFYINNEMRNAKISINEENPLLLPAISVLTNTEFRAGGSIFHWLDVALLGTYTWYPPANKIIEKMPFGYVSGHELFGGLEISTRCWENLNIKIGYETFNGDYNFLTEKASPYKESNTFDNLPFTLSNFTVTLGFSLRTYKNNMLRLWQKPLAARY